MTISTPAYLPTWARSGRWQTFAHQLTRYYTNRGGLNAWTLTLLDPSSPQIAWASAHLRQIALNPAFPEATGYLTLARSAAPTLAELTELNLRGYLAHEAGHVRFSCERPTEPALGELWNYIEDERIERRMAHVHPGLAPIFTRIGDIHLQLAANRGDLSTANLLQWTLLWRWGHDHPLFNDRPADPRWPDVRRILEAAWAAPSSEDVIEAAREILTLLDMTPEEQIDTMPQINASGGGSDQREEPPGQPSPSPSQETPDPAAQQPPGPPNQQQKTDPGTDQNDTQGTPDPDQRGEPDSASVGSEQDKHTQADSNQSAASPSGEAPQNSTSTPDAAQGDSSGDTQQDGTPSDAGDSEQPGRDATGPTAPSSDAASPAGGSSGDAQQDNNGTPSGTASDPQQDSAESRQEPRTPGTTGEGRASLADPVAPDTLTDDPRSVIPTNQADSGAEPQLAQRRVTTVLITDHEALARRIVPLIQAKDKAGMETADRSRGRFSYERHIAGADRQFRRRTLPTRQLPVQLTVLADVSGSTSSQWNGDTCLHGISHAATAFARAGQIAAIPVEVYGFESGTTAIAPRGLTPRQAYEATLAYAWTSAGGTTLAPALQHALCRPIKEARHLIVIISDGQLRRSDLTICTGLLQQHRRPLHEQAVLPLLVNTDQEALQIWRTLFPQARPADSTHDLAQLTISVLSTLQQTAWRAH
ncbi:hypothetical protein [Deinococcus ruber]|uniref:VWFA domain-containing protein n=1 Tax=Deinococcus ruber TaxID=1848197 RepID=A0A918F7S7_9DEIO|nr:hypothetical protein [Deinococcus ruber]GGR17188.1 hypothetical protein GCM10008957_32250 [Deinococcus ruber]